MGRKGTETVMNRALITGGGGFVGRAITHQLLAENVDCCVLGRNGYPDLEARGVTCIKGDISDRELVVEQVKDVDVVFHVAALAGIWGRQNQFYTINVNGTANIIEACLLNKIPALVHTSTPSVVFAGEDIERGDEKLDYPHHFLCHYAETKAIAEKQILQVDQNELKTCAIRPHLVWGPADPHLIPRLIDRGKKRKLKIVGDGQNMVDISYVDNVAIAHVLAAKNLLNTAESSGNAYFIGQERPVKLWEWINDLFGQLNIPLVQQRVPLQVAYGVGQVLEIIHGIFLRSREPAMTRFVAQQLGKSHYFSHERATQDFGYHPRISIEEGMERLLHWLKNI